MKVLWVVAGALITPDFKVLLSQRPAGKSLAGMWEYPGGKIEQGETPERALHRELNEELQLDIDVRTLEPLSFASYDYDGFHLAMPLFVCREWGGTPVGAEGQKLEFVDAATVGLSDAYPMPPADVSLSAAVRLWTERAKK